MHLESDSCFEGRAACYRRCFRDREARFSVSARGRSQRVPVGMWASRRADVLTFDGSDDDPEDDLRLEKEAERRGTWLNLSSGILWSWQQLVQKGSAEASAGTDCNICGKLLFNDSCWIMFLMHKWSAIKMHQFDSTDNCSICFGLWNYGLDLHFGWGSCWDWTFFYIAYVIYFFSPIFKLAHAEKMTGLIASLLWENVICYKISLDFYRVKLYICGQVS